MIGKRVFLWSIVVFWAVLGIAFYMLVQAGHIDRAPVPVQENEIVFEERDFVEVRTDAAIAYFEEHLMREDGYVYLYDLVGSEAERQFWNNTNSEAISYTLQWAVQEGDKETFDTVLTYTEQYMLHPNHDYMQWRLTPENVPEGDGINSATDAELRSIKALLLAEERWGDQRYSQMIDRLAAALEKIGVTDDGYLAPYGGPSGPDAVWTAREVWLSYEDFTVFEALSERRGQPWTRMYERMKVATLDAQIWNGLYNTMLTEERVQGNSLDGGDGHSINSMWIMVRAAESDDPELRESARTSLAFYKDRYERTNELFALYSSSGDPLSPTDTPWVYALVGRAAAELDDEAFADVMIQKLLEKQVGNQVSELYGAFPESAGDDLVVGQFTQQESILTLQAYLAMRDRLAEQ